MRPAVLLALLTGAVLPASAQAQQATASASSQASVTTGAASAPGNGNGMPYDTPSGQQAADAFSSGLPTERPLIGTRAAGPFFGGPATGASTPGAAPDVPLSYAGETQIDAREANSVPRTMPPSITTLSPNRSLTPKQSAQLSMVRRWRSRFVRPTLGADGWMHLIYGDGEPSIVCAPLHICTIALQPGEVVTAPPDISDPRWIVHPRYTIDDSRKVINVILKPTDAGLDGTIVITTDRRVYSINLVSRSSEYMPLVKFDYVDANDEDASGGATEWAAAAMSGRSGSTDACDNTPVVPPASYRISGGNEEPWKPVQVWGVATSVGEKTCVEFASDIGSKPLPALVALGNDGDWFSSPTPQIINFRYVNRRFEIDEALDRFELISGVGSDQEKVEITRIRHS